MNAPGTSNGWSNGLSTVLGGGIAMLHVTGSKIIWWTAEGMIVAASLCFLARAGISAYWWIKRHT